MPCLTVPAEEEQPISTWGQRHLDYLKQYRKVTYTNLLTSGRLNTYLANVDRQARVSPHDDECEQPAQKKLQPQADLPPDEKRAYAGRDTPKEEALHHVGTARYR